MTTAIVPAIIPAGNNNIGDVDVVTLPALPTGTNTIGVVGMVATATGGLSSYTFLSTAAVQAANIKASAGQVYGLVFFNNTATICYVRLYNQTTSPGTGDAANIKLRAIIPANASGAGFAVDIPAGLAFSTGIGIRVTAAVADADATALAANAILGNVLYF